jgi:hypothetical protein
MVNSGRKRKSVSLFVVQTRKSMQTLLFRTLVSKGFRDMEVAHLRREDIDEDDLWMTEGYHYDYSRTYIGSPLPPRRELPLL